MSSDGRLRCKERENNRQFTFVHLLRGFQNLPTWRVGAGTHGISDDTDLPWILLVALESLGGHAAVLFGSSTVIRHVLCQSPGQLLIQHLTHLGDKVLHREWFLNEIGNLIQRAVLAMTSPVGPDMKEHLIPGQRERISCARFRPCVSGMTWSVMSRRILSECSSAMRKDSLGVEAANTG
jgi:hypothetical protein